MIPCINEATTMKCDFATDIKAYGQAGFEAVELWLAKVYEYLKDHSLDDAKKLLKDHSLKSVSACYKGGLMLVEGEEKEKSRKEFEEILKICGALETPILIVPESSPQCEKGMYEKASANMQEAADIAKKYGVTLAMEFLKGSKFLGSLKTATYLNRKIDRKNVGILFDTFHFYAGVSKMADIAELKKGEIKFFHVNDVAPEVPRDAWEDRHRVLLGEGVLPLKEICKAVEKTGYTSYASLELFSKKLWAEDPLEVAKKGLASFKNIE